MSSLSVCTSLCQRNDLELRDDNEVNNGGRWSNSEVAIFGETLFLYGKLLMSQSQ